MHGADGPLVVETPSQNVGEEHVHGADGPLVVETASQNVSEEHVVQCGGIDIRTTHLAIHTSTLTACR